MVAVLLPDLSLAAVTDFQCLQGHGDNLAWTKLPSTFLICGRVSRLDASCTLMLLDTPLLET